MAHISCARHGQYISRRMWSGRGPTSLVRFCGDLRFWGGAAAVLCSRSAPPARGAWPGEEDFQFGPPFAALESRCSRKCPNKATETNSASEYCHRKGFCLCNRVDFMHPKHAHFTLASLICLTQLWYCLTRFAQWTHLPETLTRQNVRAFLADLCSCCLSFAFCRALKI